MYSISEFSEKTHVAVKTLQKWDREGKLPAKRMINNRRYYTDEDVYRVLGITRPENQRKTVIYARVSSAGQKGDLQNQKTALDQSCVASGRMIDERLEDIGSGLNFKRKNFMALMKQVERGEIKEIIVAHKDRLACFGYEWFEAFCVTHGTTLTVMNVESLSPEKEMTQDLLAIIDSFSSRLYGLRKYKKALKEMVADDPHD